ncbi:MAG: ABC transporter ATP-binding protein [Spirochaetales bacterium]|nr:ABC transporter ATP-binding protein [Spirochaetales bacterium]
MSKPSDRIDLRSVLRLDRPLRLVWQASPLWTLSTGGLVVLQGALPLASLYLIKLIFDAVAQAIVGPATGNQLRYVLLLVVSAGGLALVTASLQAIVSVLSELHAQVVTDHVQDLIHSKSIEVDLEYYENSDYFDTLHRAQREAAYRPTAILNDLLAILRSGVSILAIALLVGISLRWTYMLVLIAAMIPGLAVRLKYANWMYSWRRRKTATERRVDYYSMLLTGDWHAKEIRLFGIGPLFAGRSRDLRGGLREERGAILRKRSTMQFLTQSLQVLVVFGALGLVVYRTVQGHMSVGDLAMFYQAFQRIQSYSQEILSGIASLYENNLFVVNLYEFLALEPRIRDRAGSRLPPAPFKEGFRFEGVSFGYPGTERDVLHHIDLTIAPGKIVAIVGQNGAGKTTLIKLLCRLYDPTEGCITLDGLDLRELALEELRRNISVLFQDFGPYQLTARENIWLGDTQAEPASDRVAACAQAAGAEQFIEGLPNGYETLVGRWFEGGEELSVGQWQKLATARALFRDSQLLVLDEPTSNLDTRSEANLVETVRQRAAHKAVVLISHRVSTVNTADCIYVLDQGRIVESGSPRELLRKGGAYAALYELQADHFRVGDG